jgi:cystathionine beta-lyase/cystathionine gamma-synthase
MGGNMRHGPATRMFDQQKCATRVAPFLELHPKLRRVLYPGLESFPQYALARRQMRSYDVNFAQGGIRLSIGLEDWHDIIEELRAAFETI